jgi:hypothetical protein
MALKKSHIFVGYTGRILTAGFAIACMPLTVASIKASFVGRM